MPPKKTNSFSIILSIGIKVIKRFYTNTMLLMYNVNSFSGKVDFHAKRQQ